MSELNYFKPLGELDTLIIHELDNQRKKRLILLRNFIFKEVIKLENETK
jgi:hypothetical protein